MGASCSIVDAIGATANSGGSGGNGTTLTINPPANQAPTAQWTSGAGTVVSIGTIVQVGCKGVDQDNEAITSIATSITTTHPLGVLGCSLIAYLAKIFAHILLHQLV